MTTSAGRNLLKFEKKTVQNAAYDGYESNVSGAAFRLPHQLTGFLLLLLGLSVSLGQKWTAPTVQDRHTEYIAVEYFESTFQLVPFSTPLATLSPKGKRIGDNI